MTIEHRWSPIEPLSTEEQALDLGLQPLMAAWFDSQVQLNESSRSNLDDFNERLMRRWSVETGILERLYDVDRGMTEQLVMQGFVEDLVLRSNTDVEPGRLIRVLRDHEDAYKLIRECVDEERELTIGLIHQLHFALTQHQDTIQAFDDAGREYAVQLLKGIYKQLPNNPSRPDGSIHEYCPPLQVAPEMERLLQLLESYKDLDPIVVAAWLHHRFAQIHPYLDGNGRVARALTALVLLRGGLLPIVIDREDRNRYLDALEAADAGDLTPLAIFFSEQEQELLLQVLSVEGDEEAGKIQPVVRAVIASVGQRLRRRQQQKVAELAKVDQVAESLRGLARNTIQQALSDLREGIRAALPDSYTENVYVEEGGPDKLNAHWYKNEVIMSARDPNSSRDSKAFVNFDRPHYFVKGAFRAEHERLVIVTSLHHVGRQDFGVMEATAFARTEPSLDTPEERENSLPDFRVCSRRPFVFAFGTLVEDVSGSFTQWLDEALAIAIMEFGNRL